MKRALRIFGKISAILICLLLLFLLVIFIYNRVMLSKEKELISSPLGDMIEVDGKNMCVYTEGSGEHTLVFMSGYGTPSPILDFKPLYNKLCDDFRIVVVEKFGYGFSDETDEPRDIDTMLRQTREALTGAGVEGPFILCPHSASGIEAIYWAQKYPEEVEGIAAFDIAMPGYHKNGFSTFEDHAMSFIVNSGLIRLIPLHSMNCGLNSSYLTDDEKELYRALMYARRGSETMLREADACEKNVQIISNNEVPTVPMLFFTSKQMAAVISPDDPEWYLSLARNYTDNKAKYIELNCGHYVHVEEPDYIASEIRKFAEELHTD